MRINITNDRALANAAEVTRRCGLLDQAGVTDILFRVLMTKKALSGRDEDKETVYRTMQKVSAGLPNFPGDGEVFGDIYDALVLLDGRGILSFMNIANSSRELSVPHALAEKFSEYIDSETSTVLITECEQYGEILPDIVEAHPGIRFTLTTHQPRKSDILSAVFEEYENVEVETADIYSNDSVEGKYDLIFCIPSLGGRTLIKAGSFIGQEPYLIAVQNLIECISKDGRLVMVLPAQITFSGGDAARLRDYIDQNYRIREISALPSGLFIPHTAVRTYLFVFSVGRGGDVVLRQYDSDQTDNRRQSVRDLALKNELTLSESEFAGLNGWNIDMAFLEEDEDIKKFYSSAVKKAHLCDVASVFRGKAVSSRENKGNIAVVNISDIKDTGIDYTDLDRIEEEERKILRYALSDGDVLVTARGTTLKTALFEKQPVTCIASANIIVIRPRDMLRGGYLRLFLESSAGKKMLQSLQRGTAIMNINFSDLMGLDIPVPPLEIQDELTEEYNAGLNLYKDTVTQAEKKWQNILGDIQMRLF